MRTEGVASNEAGALLFTGVGLSFVLVGCFAGSTVERNCNFLCSSEVELSVIGKLSRPKHRLMSVKGDPAIELKSQRRYENKHLHR